MVLDVKRIINTPGGRIPFDFTEDFSDVDFGGVCPAVRPLSVVGQAENIAGVLRLLVSLFIGSPFHEKSPMRSYMGRWF